MSNLAIKFKDGDDDGGEVSVSSVTVEVVSNGYIARFVFDDEEEVTEVYVDKKLLLEELRKYL